MEQFLECFENIISLVRRETIKILILIKSHHRNLNSFITEKTEVLKVIHNLKDKIPRCNLFINNLTLHQNDWKDSFSLFIYFFYYRKTGVCN